MELREQRITITALSHLLVQLCSTGQFSFLKIVIHLHMCYWLASWSFAQPFHPHPLSNPSLNVNINNSEMENRAQSNDKIKIH